MNYISFVTLQITDWNRMVFVQEKTAVWKVHFHDQVLAIKSNLWHTYNYHALTF